MAALAAVVADAVKAPEAAEQLARLGNEPDFQGPAELRAVAIGLCRGLAAAHRRGVLHRDLKPANALYTDEGEVKLLDFGMAKLVDRSQPAAPEPLVGSPLYLAPELPAGTQVVLEGWALLEDGDRVSAAPRPEPAPAKEG